MITSRQNKQVKELRGLLSSARKRREAGRFVLEGVRLAEEALQADWTLHLALYTEDISPRGQELLDQLALKRVPAEACHPDVFASLSDTQHAQGIMLLAQSQSAPIPDTPNFVLILDAVQDPGNLGSLMRSALAAGVQALWLAPECVDVTSPKVLRAGMGAHFRLPWRELSWSQISAEIDQRQIACFVSDVSDGVDFREADYSAPSALVLGNEAHGVGTQALNLAQQRVHIPMHSASESLNAAAAGAVLLFEIARQKGMA